MLGIDPLPHVVRKMSNNRGQSNCPRVLRTLVHLTNQRGEYPRKCPPTGGHSLPRCADESVRAGHIFEGIHHVALADLHARRHDAGQNAEP